VGPACYNPNENTVRRKDFVPDFQSSKVGRKVFEAQNSRDNQYPAKTNPGPGSYEYLSSQKKNFNANGQHATFLSKVPNCADYDSAKVNGPGPGAYERDANDPEKGGMNLSFISDSHKRTASEGIRPAYKSKD